MKKTNHSLQTHFLDTSKPIMLILLLLGILFLLQSCQDDGLSDAADIQISFPQKLSDYRIYSGLPGDLTPTKDYHLYELGSTLFTDFAEKQRLIKLPAGTQMEKIDDDLFSFPNGAIIVKTFYYYNDKRDRSKGTRIIETRLLIKEAGKWNVADYLWNEEQTDATLIEDGLNTTVNYINEKGEPLVLAYHVPSNRECATCHLNNEQLTPIGPKLRNFNISIETALGTINQLSYFQKIDMLNDFEIANLPATPDYHDADLTSELRARAYLDINCGHCHYPDGYASDTELILDYGIALEESNIESRKGDIISNLNEGKMPYLGTSILDEEGIQLIKEFLNNL